MAALRCLKNIIRKMLKMYRFIKLYSALAIVALAFAQCTQDITTDIYVGEQNKTSATKIINTSRSAVSGSLLVKFDEEGVRALEQGTRSGSGVTRSNIEPLNNILLDIDAVSIERLIPFNLKHEEDMRKAGLHRWYIVHFDNEQPLDKVAQRLASVGEVEKIEFNTQMEMPKMQNSTPVEMNNVSTRLSTPTFNDKYLNQQWDFHNTGKHSTHAVAGMDINVFEAWKYTTGDNSVIVSVVDTGVAYTHEDLVDNMWVNSGEIAGDGIDNDGNGYIDDIHGYNFVDKGPVSWDKEGDGHGTHVAGTISAVNNNGKGVCGIAGGDGSGNGVRIMSAQIFSGNNENNASVAVASEAITYSANNGAVLANNSWGTKAMSGQNDSWYMNYESAIQDACKYFQSKQNHPNLIGGLLFFASGNDYFSQSGYPAAYIENISVTSVGIDGMPASYTNYGPGCNIAAPGGDQKTHGGQCGIASTMVENGKDTYTYEQGTSMACPHVTGVAALGVAYAKKLGKTLTAEEFKTKLLTSVNDIDSDIKGTSFSKYLRGMGTGRIDAFKMLMNIEGITCIPVVRGKMLYSIKVCDYLSDGKVNLKLIEENGVEISEEDKKKLGISDIVVLPNSGTIRITCENIGSAIISVKMIAGGDKVGGSDSAGGYVISKKFALIVRDSFAENGGWL